MFDVVLLVMAGVLAGAINSVAGGGAILIFPALLSLGLSPITATATISIAVLPGLLGSVVGYRQELQKVPKSFLLLIIPCLVGALIGAWGLYTINPDTFEAIIPWLVLSAAVLLALQTQIHNVIVTEKHLVKTNREWGFPLMILTIFVLAIYGGFFGVGVGLMLLAVVGLSSQIKNSYQLSALKNWYVFGMALVACIFFLSSGLLNVRYGLIIAVGTAIGGYLGARYSKKVSSHAVHTIAVVLAFSIAIFLFIK